MQGDSNGRSLSLRIDLKAVGGEHRGAKRQGSLSSLTGACLSVSTPSLFPTVTKWSTLGLCMSVASSNIAHDVNKDEEFSHIRPALSS